MNSPIKKNIIAFILIVAILCNFLSSCGNDRKEEHADVIFNIDSTLLGPRYENLQLKFAFYPPKDCHPLSDGLLIKIRTRLDSIAESSDSIRFQLIQIFVDSTNQFSCSVSRIIHTISDSNSKDSTSNYLRFLKDKFATATIQKGTYKLNDFEINQYLLITEQKVIFKLTFASPGNKIIQLDYAIARSIYPDFIRHIESSIGSISKLN
ncbi:hypothetical protein ACFLSX_01260 [Calditrichota bacterium]